MELLALLASLSVLSLLTLFAGADSRPLDDPRSWWPGARGGDDLPTGRA